LKFNRLKIGSIFLSLFWMAAAARAIAAPDTAARVWPVPDWTVATPESQGVSADKLEKLRAYFEEKKTRAALVVRHGKIVGEWYWDNKDKDSKFPAYSVTKSFSSTAIGMLIADRKLKLDQPAADFIPAWKDDDRKGITIRHLISMTSGLKLEDLSYFMSKEQMKLSIAQPLKYPPGTHWDYNNLACNTLSEIVTKASGEELGDFLQHRLYDPLGMKQVSMDKNGGKTLAYVGLQISARELAKMGYLFLNKGMWNGKRILPESWVKMATSSSQDLTTAYGFLWWVRTHSGDPKLPKDSYNAIGLFGNYLSVFPSQDLIVIRLIGNGSGKLTDVDGDEFARLALDALKD
jgi:CubicO group peptidase (beta-lactamase class C family)